MKLKSMAVVTALSCICLAAYASSYVVANTTLQLYTQSTDGSTAHMVEASTSLLPAYSTGEHPWCARRMYIDFADTDLYARALAASESGKSVNIIYEDQAAGKDVNGHASNLTCKLISIF